MQATIAILPGDGIGPEIMDQAIAVLHRVEKRFGHRFECVPALVGGAAYDVTQQHFPPATQEICKHSQAILFGAIGGPQHERHLPKWDGCEVNSILALRKAFQFNCNLRPARVYRKLRELSPLRPDI